jgi:uncharacterized protein YneF (UPF0154 family)
MNTVLIVLGIIAGVILAGFIALQVFFYFTKKWEDKKEY